MFFLMSLHGHTLIHSAWMDAHSPSSSLILSVQNSDQLGRTQSNSSLRPFSSPNQKPPSRSPRSLRPGSPGSAFLSIHDLSTRAHHIPNSNGFTSFSRLFDMKLSNLVPCSLHFFVCAVNRLTIRFPRPLPCLCLRKEHAKITGRRWKVA